MKFLMKKIQWHGPRRITRGAESKQPRVTDSWHEPRQSPTRQYKLPTELRYDNAVVTHFSSYPTKRPSSRRLSPSSLSRCCRCSLLRHGFAFASRPSTVRGFALRSRIPAPPAMELNTFFSSFFSFCSIWLWPGLREEASARNERPWPCRCRRVESKRRSSPRALASVEVATPLSLGFEIVENFR